MIRFSTIAIRRGLKPLNAKTNPEPNSTGGERKKKTIVFPFVKRG
jgi:hypothetical protein